MQKFEFSKTFRIGDKQVVVVAAEAAAAGTLASPALAEDEETDVCIMGSAHHVRELVRS